MSILDEAKEIVHGGRQADYGTPLKNHSTTAEFWNAYLSRCKKPINARDVCWLNILQKISRDLNNPKRDNLVDTVGYAYNIDLIDEDLSTP